MQPPLAIAEESSQLATFSETRQLELKPSLSSVDNGLPVRFATRAITLVLFASLAVSAFANAAAMDSWFVSPTAWAALAVAGYFYLKTRQAWAHVRICSSPPIPYRLMKTAVVYMALFLIVAAASGYAIGSKRLKHVQLDEDLKQLIEIRGRIVEKRTDVEPSLEGFVEMYISLRPDLDQYEDVLRRIRAGISSFAGAENDLNVLNTELNRVSLLRQQLAVARKIESAEAEDQELIWQSEMQPLLAAEDRLEKE